MKLGLLGIIDDMISKSEFDTNQDIPLSQFENQILNHRDISKVISFIENYGRLPFPLGHKHKPAVLGITGTGGAGKSSLIDELLLRFHQYLPELKIALISVDPTKKKTQGALLGDRIRLGAASFDQFFIRSLATRNSKTELSPHIKTVINFLKTQSFNLIIVETSGIGQASDEITSIADQCIYVMTPEFGAATQLEKIEMLESANFIVINKFEKTRAEDAWKDVAKQYRRNHQLFANHPGSPSDDELPIYGTIASKFNNHSINSLFVDIAKKFQFKPQHIKTLNTEKKSTIKINIIPLNRSLYLRNIAETIRSYNQETHKIEQSLKNYESLKHAALLLPNNVELKNQASKLKEEIPAYVFQAIKDLHTYQDQLQSGEFSYSVRQKEFKVKTKYYSLGHLHISKIASPKNLSLANQFRFIRKENFPGFFPYTAGTFPFKREDEDPTRMFAGEGGPVRTNQRFHYLSKNDPFKRLSTAFDSVTLYGEDPHERPDIFGKIGEAGVSIATLDDMSKLYDGFDLADNKVSVSMTINGPAPIILAMYMNTAIKQNLSKEDYWNTEKRIEIIRKLRGTVQADILKEDQAQNTCIFSLEFSLKLMGDIQEYFCNNSIRNYYSVSISGYHIAEAGANPITQTSLTLSNGFTFVEYYLSRGMKIDEFAENLSFFFSNGLDPEYAVIGRVARKIWAITLRDKYNANTKSQKFKYHIQTSGRSLHAQEIDFNDIRTTLQALLALSDNCNSLHTNAYDEAITTPTEESVRRAMAIQMIINREFGISKTENPFQGSYLINELTDLG